MGAWLSKDHHRGTPENNGDLGHIGPVARSLISIGAAYNTDDGSEDVRKRQEKECDGYGIGKAGRGCCDSCYRRYDIGDRAIGNRILPEGLTEWELTFPKR